MSAYVDYEQIYRLSHQAVENIQSVSTWQQLSNNEWVYGVKVRGVVRKVLANVSFSPVYDSRSYSVIYWQWIWVVTTKEGRKSGNSQTLQIALEEAEKVMGIE